MLTSSPEDSFMTDNIGKDTMEIIEPLQRRNAWPIHRKPTSSSQHLLSNAQRSDKPQRPRFRNLCRAIGFNLLYQSRKRYARGSRVFERPKIAICADRLTASLAGLIHVIPVVAAVAIIILNAQGLYISGELAGRVNEDTQKLASLQFAAKVHELMIQASLGAIVFTYIRKHLALGDGLPFGAIFAGLRVRDVSFLWSQEFWGTARAPLGSLRQKAMLIMVILFGTLLCVSVGPSSAILMTPRFDDWPAGGTDFWVNSTQHDLWPRRINASHIPQLSCFEDQGDESCPYGNWRTLAEEYFEYWPRLNEMDTMPETTQIPSPKSVRELYSRGRKGLYRNRFTVATTQHSVMADAVADTAKFWLYAALNIKQIETFRFRKDATFTVDAYQPVTHVRCNMQTWSNKTSYLPVFPVLSYQDGDMFPQRSYSDNGVAQLLVQHSALKMSGPQLHWLELPKSTFGNSSIGAMILLPQDTSGISFLMCNIDARWSANKVQSFRDNIKVVTGTSNAWLDPSTYSASWPHITVSPDWARYLNPLISGSNTTTVFQNLAAVAGLSEGTNPAPLIAESILSIMMTNGLSRINYSRALVGLLTGSSDNSSSFSWKCSKWCNEMLPSKYFSFGTGGTAFTLPEDITGPTARFTMKASVKGYAYSSRGTPAKVAIGLMILYCIVAILHYIYLCMTGISSSSWDSISDITTLAMNSKPTRALRGTSAGIDTLEVFKKRVRIVVADENHLEMTFQDDSAPASIIKNAYYS